MKQLFFLIGVILTLNIFGQVNVDPNYTKPFFQGNIKVADTLGVEDIIRFNDGSTLSTATGMSLGNGIFDATNDGDTVPTSFDVNLTDSLIFSDGTNELININYIPRVIGFGDKFSSGNSQMMMSLGVTLEPSFRIRNFNDAFETEITGSRAFLGSTEVQVKGNDLITYGFRVRTHVSGGASTPTRFEISNQDDIANVFFLNSVVGVNTTTPLTDFHVDGSIRSEDGQYELYDGLNERLAIGRINGYTFFYSTLDDQEQIRMYDDNKLIFMPDDGNVGIGDTLADDGKLQVNQSSNNSSSGVTLVGTGGPTGRSYMNASNQFVLQKASNTNQLVLSDGGCVSVNTTTIDPSAIFEATSTTKGFLPPRQTTVQRDAISNPAPGLQIFDTTTFTQNYFNGTDWISTPSNEIVILSESQFDTTATGEIFLRDGIGYKLGVNTLVVTRPIILDSIVSISSLRFEFNRIIYTGTGPLFRGSLSGSFIADNALIIGNASSSVWDIKGNGNSASNILVVDKSTYVGFGSVGVIDSIGAINYNFIQHANDSLGLVFKDIGILGMNNSPINNINSSKSPRVVLDGTFNSIKIAGSGLVIQNGESFLQLSKNINITGDVVIGGNQFSAGLGGEFLATDKTGSITVFSDNGSGGTTVKSLSHGLTIEQVAEITGTTSYNGVQQDIFSVTDSTFDINVTFVADDATGSFNTGNSNNFLDSNKFSFRTNGQQIDTDEELEYNSVNTISITIAGANTPVNIVGSAIDWTPKTERRFEVQASGDPNGSARMINDKTQAFKVSARVTVDVIGGSAKLMTAYLTINGVVQTDSRFTFESARTVTLHPEELLTLSQSDYIGVAIENNDDATNIDVLNVSVIAD